MAFEKISDNMLSRMARAYEIYDPRVVSIIIELMGRREVMGVIVPDKTETSKKPRKRSAKSKSRKNNG